LRLECCSCCLLGRRLRALYDSIKSTVLVVEIGLERKNPMSETSTLIPCNSKITREELANVPTPPATTTHVPIPHLAVVEGLVETLGHRQIGVVGEEFAVSKDGMEMFGVIDLESSFDGCRFAIGIQNANNKRFRLLHGWPARVRVP
jgi:hypothetical protein